MRGVDDYRCKIVGKYKMENVKVAFVILYYLAFDITCKCITELENNMDVAEYKIVVVDNCSPDNSYSFLLKKYGNNDKVDILHSDNNLGFTKGNNFGIDYVKHTYNFEFLVLLNNDAFLIDTMFYSKIKKIYEECNFAVAGPRIVDIYGKDYNPCATKLPSRETIENEIKIKKRMIKYNNFHLLPFVNWMNSTRSTLEVICKILRGKELRKKIVWTAEKNVILHGCFWIFSKEYFDFFSGLIDKKYMFAEEETLFWAIREKKLLSLFIPDILVLHLGDSSINERYKKKSQRVLFQCKNVIGSWKEFLELTEKK